MSAEVMCGDRPTMLFRVLKLWSILLTPANYERGTSDRGSDARSGGSLWPKLRSSWQCLLILLITALLLVMAQIPTPGGGLRLRWRGVRPLAFPRLVLQRSLLAVCLEKRWACALRFLQGGSQNVHDPISLIARPITPGNPLNAPLSAAFGITAVNARKYLSNG